MAAGEGHRLILLSNGTAKAWGLNNTGQPGLGNNISQTSPHSIPALVGLTAADALEVGRNHSLALQPNGAVRAWGEGAIRAKAEVVPGLSRKKPRRNLASGAWARDQVGRHGDELGGGIRSFLGFCVTREAGRELAG